MIDFENLDSKEILDLSIYDEIYAQEDEFERLQATNSLILRAKELRMVGMVKQNIDRYEKKLRERQHEEDTKSKQQVAPSSGGKVTEFYPDKKGVEYVNLYCGSWIATEEGIYSMTSSRPMEIACYHPILPIERMVNMETGEEYIRLVWKRNGIWHEKTVSKEIIATARNITSLAKFGISVTSENAKLLVKYLSDVENWNNDHIQVVQSSSKMGWHKVDTFLPYDEDIVFDGDARFHNLKECIRSGGDYSAWLKCMHTVRASKSLEPRLALAASFASPLVKVYSGLPFIVDLNGETEGGKTVCLMVAASVWADPAEHQYIGDFKSTDVALEVRADMLNNLPMILDDTSKASARIRDNFESLVYDLCSGKGKSRSNKDLGADREYTWLNTIICNGEKPLSYYVEQGGAINRILEVECQQKIFNDPRMVAETVKWNYGHAGKIFIEHIKGMTKEQLDAIQQKHEAELFKLGDKMQKQILAVSIILAADEIATECIFKDGNQLKAEDVKSVLTDRSKVSENSRCYEYLIDSINEHMMNFDPLGNAEQWGILEPEQNKVFFYKDALKKQVEKEGYSFNAFVRWAINQDLLVTREEKGIRRDTVVKKFNGRTRRMVCLKLVEDVDEFFDAKKEESEDATLFN